MHTHGTPSSISHIHCAVHSPEKCVLELADMTYFNYISQRNNSMPGMWWKILNFPRAEQWKKFALAEEICWIKIKWDLKHALLPDHPHLAWWFLLLLLLPPLLSKCCCRNSGKQNWIIRECLIRLNYSFTELLLLRSKNKWNINDNKSSVGKCILNFDRIKWPHKYRLSYKWIAVRSCTVSYH